MRVIYYCVPWFGGCEDYHNMVLINFDWCYHIIIVIDR